MTRAEWQKGDGSPCAHCWMRNTCAASDHRCQEWISWFYRDFRRRWRNLRIRYGFRDEKKVVQYRAPYEQEPGAEPERERTAERKNARPGPAPDPEEEARKKEIAAHEARCRAAEAAEWLEELEREREQKNKRDFGGKLKAMLKAYRITQKLLAAESNVGESTVSRAVTGKLTPGDQSWKQMRGAIIKIVKGEGK